MRTSICTYAKFQVSKKLVVERMIAYETTTKTPDEVAQDLQVTQIPVHVSKIWITDGKDTIDIRP